MRAPYRQDWIEFSLTDPTAGLIMGGSRSLIPGRPTPLSAPHDLPSPVGVCGYDITQPPSTYLRAPEPYDTFAHTFSY